MIYADSIIATAIRSKVDDQIARAYLGKGIIYYYNRRKYKPALEQYLLAYKFSSNSADQYLKNKVLYHLGLVKCYLGYYQEAAQHFEQAANFFGENINKNLHPNVILNNESGYFNSIYHLSYCYKNLHLYYKEDSLINIALKKLQNTNLHPLEYGYFQKAKGSELLRKGKYDEALNCFKSSDQILSHEQDFASLTEVYFYLGKIYHLKNNRRESLFYFTKVDSLVNKFWFVTPEIRSSYEYLIDDAKKYNKPHRQLYFTNQLLKVDSILTTDFAVLSPKIYREYDKETLLHDKNKLIYNLNSDVKLLYFAIIFSVIIFCFLIWRFLRNEKKLSVKYQALLKKYSSTIELDHFKHSEVNKIAEKNIYSNQITEQIETNLKAFEDKKLFLKPNLTILKVAKMIGSNRTHLSYVLNVNLRLSFPLYLKTLRINYITKLLLEDNKYLNYKIDTLAKECGIVNRQLFSAHFLEINGIRPIDFIRKRKEELEKLKSN